MCGRYVRRSDKQRLVEYFHTGATVFDIPPSYNVAPMTFQPVIRLNRDTGEREITMMRWGLIPSWCATFAMDRFAFRMMAHLVHVELVATEDESIETTKRRLRRQSRLSSRACGPAPSR